LITFGQASASTQICSIVIYQPEWLLLCLFCMVQLTIHKKVLYIQ
jgi:hypothetical protein